MKLGEGEMDGVAFQHLMMERLNTQMYQCDKSSGRRRATVGLEQCGCRQETEVELARKSIGFLPTITSNSIEHKGRTISTSIAEESS